jgi:hypothetical protein
MVERPPCKRVVVGSNPIVGSIVVSGTRPLVRRWGSFGLCVRLFLTVMSSVSLVGCGASSFVDVPVVEVPVDGSVPVDGPVAPVGPGVDAPLTAPEGMTIVIHGVIVVGDVPLAFAVVHADCGTGGEFGVLTRSNAFGVFRISLPANAVGNEMACSFAVRHPNERRIVTRNMAFAGGLGVVSFIWVIE